MRTYFRNLFKKKEQTPIKESYSFAGHNFYVLDPLKMTVGRQEAMHSNDHELSNGLSNEKEIEALETLAKELKSLPTKYSGTKELVSILQEKNTDAATALEDIAMLKKSTEKNRAYIKTGAIFILIDDEVQSDDPFGKHYGKKLELCERHEEIRNFFLRLSHHFHLSMIKPLDVTKVWEWCPSIAVEHLERKIITKSIPSMQS